MRFSFADKNDLLITAFDTDLPKPGSATVEENLHGYAVGDGQCGWAWWSG